MAMDMTSQSSKYNVRFGNDNDACIYCVVELMKKENISEPEAFKKLRGAHLGEKIWYMGGTDNICVCKDHLKKILGEITLNSTDEND